MRTIILYLFFLLLPWGLAHASTYEITTPGNNVGIGSTTPGQALDVQGTIRSIGSNSAINFTGGNLNGNGASELDVSSANLGIGTNVPDAAMTVVGTDTSSSTNGFNVKDSSKKELFKVLNNGTVSINTTKPDTSTTFQIVQNGSLQAELQSTAPLSTTAGSVLRFIQDSGSTVVNTSRLGAIQFYGNQDGSHTLSPGASIESVASENWSGSANGGQLRFYTTQSTTQNPTLRMILTGAGNIGIGTNIIPGATLDITSGSNNIAIKAINQSADSSVQGAGLELYSDGGTSLLDGSRTGMVFFGGDRDGAGTISLSGSVEGFAEGAWSSTSSPSRMVFFTTNNNATARSERMRIDSTGNVGIGSTGPKGTIDVGTGSICLNHVCNSTWPAGGGPPGGSPTQLQYQVNGSTLGGAAGSGVDSNGNVGIGSATPGQKLDVGGTARVTGLTLSGNGAATNYVMTSTDSSGDATWSPAASGLWATQNTTDQSLAGGNVGIGTTFTTTSALTVMNGNVGIGTWIPASTFMVGKGINSLQINSSGSITRCGAASCTGDFTGWNANNAGGQAIFGNQANTSGSTTVIKCSGATNGTCEMRTTTGVGSGDFTKFTGGNAGGTEIMRLMGTGLVGIGTAAPAQTLSIAGVIGFKQNAPTISSCGTSPNGSVVGNDAQGTITVGGTATACTLAFTGTYAKSPHCNITNQSMSVTNAMTYTESTSGFTVSQAVGLSGDLLDYHCTFDN